MTFFRSMKVYTRVPGAMQKMNGGKVIGVRWVEVNKADSETPDTRSRLLARVQRGQEGQVLRFNPAIGGVEICHLISRNLVTMRGAETHHGQRCEEGVLLCPDSQRHALNSQLKTEKAAEISWGRSTTACMEPGMQHPTGRSTCQRTWNISASSEALDIPASTITRAGAL